MAVPSGRVSSLHVVVDLGVADALDETPQTPAQLAEVLHADPDALGRVLRLLSAQGVFAVQGDTFIHNDASRLLRSDHPHSMRAFVRRFGLRAFWDTQSSLLHSLRTGRVAAEEVLPGGYYHEPRRRFRCALCLGEVHPTRIPKPKHATTHT